MIKMFAYFGAHSTQIWKLTLEHIEMTAIAVCIAILIGVPLGILISYVRKLDKPVIGAANVVQAIPSMALLGLGIPLLGIGVLPAVVMVIIYSLLPIVKNTYTGISGIDPQMVEAANGIGLTPRQVLTRVKIPMALPVIMAGVRISAVTAVGLMTMAAFIGAGGLGYLVFAGIRTTNNYQILAGAIPACILALLVDFLMGLVEKLVTPISLQKTGGISRTQMKRKRKREKFTLAAALILICAIIAGGAINNMVSGRDKEITIGGKDFTEQFILVNLYSDYIEAHTDINCVRKENLGGSQVCYEALKKGEIDMYVDYTGTLYGSDLKHDGTDDMEGVYNTCVREMKKQNITLTRQCGFNNTYTLAVSHRIAKKYNLETIENLVDKSSQMHLGCSLEFQNRHDCMDALEKAYPNLKFRKISAMDGSPRFVALANKEVDVIDAFATDGMLLKYNLKVLKDEDHVFPPYYAVPCFSSDTLKKYPELREVVDKLAPKLTDEVMMKLNYQVDVKGREPKDVAREYLKREKLI